MKLQSMKKRDATADPQGKRSFLLLNEIFACFSNGLRNFFSGILYNNSMNSNFLIAHSKIDGGILRS